MGEARKEALPGEVEWEMSDVMTINPGVQNRLLALSASITNSPVHAAEGGGALANGGFGPLFNDKNWDG